MLIEKYQAHCHQETECYRAIEPGDTPQRRMLQVKHKHIIKLLLANAGQQQHYFTSRAEEHAYSQSKMSEVARAEQRTHTRAENDANMVSARRKGGPAELLEGK